MEKSASPSFHPLLLLDEFLVTLDHPPTGDTTLGGIEGKSSTLETETLGTPSLERRTLDSPDSKRKCNLVLRVADALYGEKLLGAALTVLDTDGAVRQIFARPSGRTAFLVKGSSSSTRGGRAFSEHYFCLLPSTNAPELDMSTCYCTCWSYCDRVKRDPSALCKHLLAIKLMPYLKGPYGVETVPDAGYAKLLLNHAFT